MEKRFVEEFRIEIGNGKTLRGRMLDEDGRWKSALWKTVG
jgi:hypothetical protein